MRQFIILFSLFTLFSLSAEAKKKKEEVKPVKLSKEDSTLKALGFKPYKSVVTSKARTSKGLFTVHLIDGKYYFEIPDSLFNREMIVTTRYSKIAGGGGVYAGELANLQTVLWEKGPNKNVFLRVVTTIGVSDSTNDIYTAVTNSNMNPIAAAFPIKALGNGLKSVVIDVTDFFTGDNQPVSLNAFAKKRFNLGAQIKDRSYISTVKTFPINTEIKTVRTFISIPPIGAKPPSDFPSKTLPAAEAIGAVTLETNNSFVLLPKVPMSRRLYDPRVGFFADDYTVFSDDQQKSKNEKFIVRWRMEPRPEDMDKWKRGELVEPQKPIVYYIDPATPKKWRKYLIAGVNDWQVAFEQAGFKNAIMAKEFPKDSTMSVDDARYSVIRYLPSDIENAYGPNVHDPRSGEILESHIGWYHDVMKLVHDWYMIQAAAVDPRARKMQFDDSLMGQLIRFVSSHEVGHTLGLRHNMGSSSRTPVALLRNKQWVEANGHTASIMDYARFNYVAQPEDNIADIGLFPRIGVYDKWAIQWGYKPTMAATAEADRKIVNKWIVDSLKANPRLWFGTETNPFDPRSQTEDLGDNSMQSSSYGIKNLKRIIVNLDSWSREEADPYTNLGQMYAALAKQYRRYLGHVIKNVGGIYETPKSVEQGGDIYEPTPKATQKDAIQWLHDNCFETPDWLLEKSLINKIDNPVGGDEVSNSQTYAMKSLLTKSRLNRIAVCAIRFPKSNPYQLTEMLDDVRKGVWSELGRKPVIDGYRRNLQKLYVETLINILEEPIKKKATSAGSSTNAAFNPDIELSDVSSVVRGHLIALRSQLLASTGSITDKTSRYHVQDMADRIKQVLEPK